jgi:hypothetical protein
MSEPEVIHAEEMCCGQKRCPVVRLFSDGSAELTDDDPAAGSVGTVKLRPEVAARLAALLDRHAKK